MKKLLCVLFLLFLSSCCQSQGENQVTPVDEGGRGVEGGVVMVDDDQDLDPEAPKK